MTSIVDVTTSSSDGTGLDAVSSDSFDSEIDGGNHGDGIELYHPGDPTSRPHWAGQEDIVISGISAQFPECENVTEFQDKLFNKVDMITENDRRWEPGLFDLPKRSGTLYDLSRFDASAFGVHAKQAQTMDPQLRILLEVVYEAIVDSGTNPTAMRGTRTGVYVGNSTNETATALVEDVDAIVGYALTGNTRNMIANRISYSFDFKGPSYTVDTACSSAPQALECAMDAMRNGQIDYAIVAGAHLTLSPLSAVQFARLGMISDYGACRTFDANAEGYVRSEGIAAMLIQRASTAHRSYGTLLHVRSNNDGFKDQGITFPSGEIQARLLRESYTEAEVDPQDVVYVEAHGTGTKVGDPQEANAIDEVFCSDKKRTKPLLIGSVKSNMGHSEATSGLASLTKVLIAANTGMIAPNLHYKTPNPFITGIAEGRLKVVEEKTNLPKGLIAINSFGFGGSNVHMIFKPYDKIVDPLEFDTSIPKLLTYAGRTSDAVDNVLQHFEQHRTDRSLHQLFSEQANIPCNMQPYRGYIVVSEDGSVKDIQKCAPQSEKRPVWFVYSGMGSQWPGMARELIQIDVCHNALLRCATVLKPHGINLMDVITKDDSEVLSNTLLSFVGIVSVQIALTELLRTVGISPSGLIGHSVGELGCGYADGCMDLEQTVMCAYWRGHCVQQAKLPDGAMAAVGLTWQEATEQCPEGVVPACHNAADSVTISGPAEKVKAFVEELQAKDVFARLVETSGVAFHSHYMKQIVPELTAKLEKIMPHPKRRSGRWISSSQLDTSESAQLCSAAYHVNNLTSPVRFQEALKFVPTDAIVVEIAPHSLLQAILRRSLGSDNTTVGLMKKSEPSQLSFLLPALGKLYMAGGAVTPSHLYGKVIWPVPRRTQMIASMVKWDHAVEWDVVAVEKAKNPTNNGGISFTEDPYNQEKQDTYLLDHVIDGRPIYPFTGFLVMAWKAACKLRKLDYLKTPVSFEDVRVFKPTSISKAVRFDVVITPGHGSFEVLESGTVVASGKISILDEDTPTPFFYSDLEEMEDYMKEDDVVMSTEDVYKEWLLRGYDYGANFRGIHKASNDGRWSHLRWNGNFVTFIDTLLQTALLPVRKLQLRLPVRLRYLRIDPEKHLRSIFSDGDVDVIRGHFEVPTLGFYAGGVEACELVAQTVQRRMFGSGQATLEKVGFRPYFDDECLSDVPQFVEHVKEYIDCVEGLLLENKAKWEKAIPESKKILELLSKNKLSKEKLASFQELVSAEKGGEHYSLLKFVSEMNRFSSANWLNDARSALLSSAIHDDLLLNIGWTARIAKILGDIVLENTIGHITTCAQIEPLNVKNAVLMKKYMEQHPLVEQDWIFVGSSLSESFTEEAEADDRIKACHSGIDIDAGLDDSNIPEDLKNLDMVLMDRILCTNEDPAAYLHNASKLLRPDGFLVVMECTERPAITMLVESILGSASPRATNQRNHEQWSQTFKQAGFDISSYKRHADTPITGYLLRKLPEEQRTQTFVNVDDVTDFTWIENLQQTIEQKLTAPAGDTIWLASETVKDNGTRGLALCLKEEAQKVHRVRVIDDWSLSKPAPADLSNPTSSICKEAVSHDLMMNHYRDGKFGTVHHIEINEPSGAVQSRGIVTDELLSHKMTDSAYVTNLVHGDLSSFAWVESSMKYYAYNPDVVKDMKFVSVYYTSLNFRDVMFATGRLPPDAAPPGRDSIYGVEFVGRLSDGKRVMGVSDAQALATTIACRPPYIWDIPDHWSMVEAATIPTVYITLYYSLFQRAGLKRGETILIHSGSGGVGIAAITLALAHGCKVFTTCSTREKKKFLQARFPSLTDEQFANSRSVNFEHHIMKRTKGKGVDMVVNALAGDKLQASLRCLATHGRFLEIGKFDLTNDTPIGLGIFLRNVTFHGINFLDSMADEEWGEDWDKASRAMMKGIADGVVQPLPTTVFNVDETEQAFRYLGSGKHIGKIVMQIRPEEAEKIVVPKPIKVKAIVRTLCHPQHVYLITGGLGGFGLELAEHLVERGARKLVLTSRSGIKTAYQRRVIGHWRAKGAEIVISTRGLSTQDEVDTLIKECLEVGPIGGVFHLAMVLRDCLFENQTVQNFQESAVAKFHGTRHLDVATRKFCNDASSTLQWFVVFSSVSCGRGHEGQTNYGWSNSSMERVIERRRLDGHPGMAIQWGAIGDVGVILETMGNNSTVVGGTLPQRMLSCVNTLDYLLAANHPVMSSFVRAETRKKQEQKSGGDVAVTIARILGVSDVNTLDADANLVDLGLDSLMGVEIRQALEREYDLVLSMKDIRTLTLNKLRARVASGVVESTESSSASEDMLNNPMQFFGLRVQADDLKPSKPIVCLNPDTADKSLTPVFCVHSIEGIGTTLLSLAGQLPNPVYCLQCVPDAPIATMEELAAFYVKNMKTIQPKAPYTLVGYSFGATIAFEMSVQLEALHGQSALKALVLLDASHAYMQTYRQLYRLAYNVTDELTDNALFETEILCGYAMRFINIDYDSLRKTLLEDCPSWSSRLDKVVQMIMEDSQPTFSEAETCRFAAQTVYDKYRAADKYRPLEKPKLQTQVTLVKAKASAMRDASDYGLNEVAVKPIISHEVSGDHDSFIHDESASEVAKLITEAAKQ